MKDPGVMLSGAGTVPEDEDQDDESSQNPSSFSAIMFVKDEHI